MRGGKKNSFQSAAAVRLKSRREKKPKVIRWKGLVRRRHLIAVMHYSRQTVGTNFLSFSDEMSIPHSGPDRKWVFHLEN